MKKMFKGYAEDLFALFVGSVGFGLPAWGAYSWLEWSFPALPDAGYIDIASGLLFLSIVFYAIFAVKEMTEY